MRTKKKYTIPVIEVMFINCRKAFLQNIGDGSTNEQLGNIHHWDDNQDEGDENVERNTCIWE